MNHHAITTDLFPDKKCDCPLGAHQTIEGSVRVQDGQGRWKTVKRSTLAAEWTDEFCDWLLDGLECLWTTTDVALSWSDQVPTNQVWESVPVEIEDSPEGQLRQQLELADGKRRYDYISFNGSSALQPKRLRSTLAHLHVALGHISNEKFQRMLHQQDRNYQGPQLSDLQEGGASNRFSKGGIHETNHLEYVLTPFTSGTLKEPDSPSHTYLTPLASIRLLCAIRRQMQRQHVNFYGIVGSLCLGLPPL